MRLREKFSRKESHEPGRLFAMSKVSNVIRSTNLFNIISHSFSGKKAKNKERSFSTISMMLAESGGNSRLES